MGQWRGETGGGLNKDSKHERQISSARVQAMNKLNLWEAGFLCIVRRYIGAGSGSLLLFFGHQGKRKQPEKPWVRK